MYGILLAGGEGTRLHPITKTVSKQLLPVFDKPMIYYPLSLLIASGLNDIVLIVKPSDLNLYQKLFADGNDLGINIQYAIQKEPLGIPQAYSLAHKYTQDKSTTMMLGDNIFYGSKIAQILREGQTSNGGNIYAYLVNDVSSFGCVRLDADGKIESITEKPRDALRGYAIPGIYQLDSDAAEKTKSLKPSRRGELEIIDLLNIYLHEARLTCSVIGRGTAWLDTGTIEDLNSASELVRVMQTRQGMLIGSPEEVAYRRGLIKAEDIERIAASHKNSLYGKKLLDLLNE